jgi:hypothetical protein
LELVSIHTRLSLACRHGILYETPRLLDINLLLNFTVKKGSLNIHLVKFPTKTAARDIKDLMEVYLVTGAEISS